MNTIVSSVVYQHVLLFLACYFSPGGKGLKKYGGDRAQTHIHLLSAAAGGSLAPLSCQVLNGGTEDNHGKKHDNAQDWCVPKCIPLC